MPRGFLEFEAPIVELENKIEALEQLNERFKQGEGTDLQLEEELAHLKAKQTALTKKSFSQLSAWQIVQLARHPERPYTADYLERIFGTVDFLAGDRLFREDPSILVGITELAGRPLLVMGHQKGRSTKEKIYRNFGMPAPEGYRKVTRALELARRFRLPVCTFIDTPGAYPGVSAEERGQAEAIAKNLLVLSSLPVPIICTVIGEGGSGGALALGVADLVNMLGYSIYATISPEGCAAILWRSSDKAPVAAEVMRLTAPDLLRFGLIDQIVEEPLGGAHRDPVAMAERLKARLEADFDRLCALDVEELLTRRRARLRSYGYC